jgi:hypothetical protein
MSNMLCPAWLISNCGSSPGVFAWNILYCWHGTASVFRATVAVSAHGLVCERRPAVLGRRPHDARHTAATVFARRRHRIDRHADRGVSPRTGCRDGDPTPRVGSSTTALPVWGSLVRPSGFRAPDAGTPGGPWTARRSCCSERGGCAIRTREGVNPTRFPSLMTVDRSRLWLTAVQVGR